MNRPIELPWPYPRFETLEDAMLFMECVRTKHPFPTEKWVHPYVMLNGIAFQNPKYKHARYEANFVL